MRQWGRDPADGALVADEQPIADDNIVAVVVTYLPEITKLRALVSKVAPQVKRVVVVDNGSGEPAEAWAGITGPTVSLLQQRGNTGIAAAQNAGVAAARRLGGHFVIFFDQDSRPSERHVEQIIEAYRDGIAAGFDIAAIGPVPLDERLWQRTGVVGRPGVAGLIEVDHLISSGSLAPLSAFDRVGPLRDELFIDYVDIEWCLRAAREGLKCYCVPHLGMAHEFGTPMSALGVSVSKRPPMRQYYLVRNAIWLWGQKWVPLGWKVAKGIRLMGRLMITALFSTPRFENWSMMVRGVRDGFAGRMGRGHD
jgi:rhamnosyltransferase